MCGISGFNFKDQARIQNMNTTLKHRGPDDDGIIVENDISMGLVRLAILDPSKKGHQPMESSDKRYVITHNGEIYNFKEIRKELKEKGHTFSSESDTEVILAAFAEWNTECVKKFNGMFAFTIWDKKEKTLFGARDHAGMKPLFYYHHKGKFIYSSEIKGILEHDIVKELDTTSLDSFFRFSYILAPHTPFKHIKTLLEGHYFILKDNNLSLTKYWQPPAVDSAIIFEEGKAEIRKRFDKAVKRHLVSDKPLGIFLGGGIDSTAILGSIAAQHKEKIKTFSMRFDTDVQSKKYNEDSDTAKNTAAHYGTDHHEIQISGKDLSRCIEDVVYHVDSLDANNSHFAPYLLSQYAKTYVDVALGGDGGDELFGGYDRYYFYSVIERLQHIPKYLRKNVFAKMLFSIRGSKNIYDKINAKDISELFFLFRARDDAYVSRFLKTEAADLEGTKRRYNERFFKGVTNDFAGELMKVDFQSWLTDESLTKSDMVAMAHGIEQRMPILDKELTELAFSIPSKYKIHSKEQGKYIFKEAVKDYLPEEVYSKRKTGFFAPTAKWFRTDFEKTARSILSPGYVSGTEQYIDFKEVERLLDDHISLKTYALNSLWSVLVFQIWYKHFVK